MWAIYNNEDSVTLLSEERDRALPYTIEEADVRYYNIGPFKYYVENDNVVARRVTAEKDLNTLKEQAISKVKTIANDLLAPSDWMVTRKFERGVELPEDISTYRLGVLQACTDKEEQINSINTLEEFILFDNQVWTETHLVRHFVGDNLPDVYGPETEEKIVILSGINDLWPEDPTEEPSKTFVSRTL